MSSKKPNSRTNLVFFGTGQTSLEALQCLEESFEIELIVTKPPAKNSAGKDFKNQVQEYAEKNNIEVATPANKSKLVNSLAKQSIRSTLGVVLDFGMIIPKEVIDMFSNGILNSHFSLLPKYRGADPIRSAILSGDEVSGVTIIRITPGLDDGPILTWAEQVVGNINAIELREKLSVLNCALLPETIKLYLTNELEPVEQDASQATHTSKLTKEDGRLNPSKNPKQLEREVRAYVGWPKSYFEWENNIYIIHKAKVSTTKINAGDLQVLDKKLYFGCKNGSLEVLEVQPANKPRMDAVAFINGNFNTSN